MLVGKPTVCNAGGFLLDVERVMWRHTSEGYARRPIEMCDFHGRFGRRKIDRRGIKDEGGLRV
jgi:hypothetical protein